MIKYIFQLVICLSLIGCNSNRDKQNISQNYYYPKGNSKIINTIDSIVRRDYNIKIEKKIFIYVVVYQNENRNVTYKFAFMCNSSWIITQRRPSFVYEKDNTVYLFYNGMEKLFPADEDYIKSILNRYKNYLHQDILPDGEQIGDFVCGENKVFQIEFHGDSVLVKSDVIDPFRPPEADPRLQKINYK